MRRDQTNSPPDSVGRLAAILTRDPVLALDVEQALATAHYASWLNHEYDTLGLKRYDKSLSLAVVDLSLRDGRAEAAMEWLEERGIRTIVLATGEEPASQDVANGKDAPHIVARFLKPFVVDEILPIVHDQSASAEPSFAG